MNDLIKKTYMVFDVESVGLHGEGFSVGYIVINNGEEVEFGYFKTHPENVKGTNADYKWIEQNVLPVMNSVSIVSLNSIAFGFNDPKKVRSVFWERWMTWKNKGATLVADCLWPVEARFLIDCINDDPIARNWDGPYPFIDVSSIRLAKGFDPLGTEERKEDEKPAHHPLADARQSARLLLEALKS